MNAPRQLDVRLMAMQLARDSGHECSSGEGQLEQAHPTR